MAGHRRGGKGIAISGRMRTLTAPCHFPFVRKTPHPETGRGKVHQHRPSSSTHGHAGSGRLPGWKSCGTDHVRTLYFFSIFDLSTGKPDPLGPQKVPITSMEAFSPPRILYKSSCFGDRDKRKYNFTLTQFT